jgi:colicin import membrane protein
MKTSLYPFDLQLFSEADDAAAAAAKAKADADAAEAKAKADADAAKDSKKDEDKFDRSYVERLRREKADAETAAKALQKEKDDREAEEAKKRGDYEKLLAAKDKELAKARDEFNAELTKRDQRLVRTELRAEATAAGIIDPDLISLVDMDLVKFEDGELKGAKTAIEALKNAKPHLFKKAEESNEDEADKSRRNRNLAPNGGDKTNKEVKDSHTLSSEDFEKLWGRAGKA